MTPQKGEISNVLHQVGLRHTTSLISEHQLHLFGNVFRLPEADSDYTVIPWVEEAKG